MKSKKVRERSEGGLHHIAAVADDHADLGERELGGKGLGILQILHGNEMQEQIGTVRAVLLADHHARSHADDRPL